MLRRLAPVALATALVLLTPSAASAASCSYTGGTGGSWHTAGNWDCNEVPDSGDSVAIGNGDNVGVAAAASAGSLSLTTGGFITLSNDVTLAAGAMTVTTDGTGTIRGAGQVTVAGAFSKAGTGSLSVTNNGTFGPSADLILNGAATLSGGSICVADSGDGDPDLPNLHINDTFTISTADGVVVFPCTAGPRIHVNPSGQMIKSSAGFTLTQNGIENDGTITVEAGTLDLGGDTGGVTHSGDFVVDSGATLGLTNNQGIIGSTGRIGGAGTVIRDFGVLSMDAGSTLDPAVLTIARTGSITLRGGTAMTLPVLNFDGGGFSPAFNTDRPVTVTDLTVTGAARLSGAGSLAVPSTGSFSKTGAGSWFVTNGGTFEQSPDFILDVDATLSGGNICVADSGDGHPDLPSFQINRDFTIGAGADAIAFTCSGNVIDVNGPNGRLLKEGPGTTTNQGRIDVAGGTVAIGSGQTFVVTNGISQSAGLTGIASGGVLQGSATLTGGVLRGLGQVTGSLANASGTVEPGSSPGTLTVTGSYSQGPGGTLRTEIAGTTPGAQFDRLSVGGTATLDGTLAIVNDPAFDPALSDTFEILGAASVSGTFSSVTGAQQPSGKSYSANYGVDDVTLSVAQSPPQNTSAPTITGSALEGQTLTCNPGTWTGAPTFAFEWLRDGVPIPGATGSTYTLTPADIGRQIGCRVTGTNSAGSAQAGSGQITPTARAAGPSSPSSPSNPSPSGGGGGLISAAGCLNTDARLSGEQLGPARLGRKLAQQRAIFQGANLQTRANLDRFCAEGGGNFRIGYPTPRLTKTLPRSLARKVKDRVVIMLTSSRRFSLRGIEVGDTVAEARSKLAREKAFRIGSNTWYVAKRGPARLLVKTKGGRVGEIGIGDPRLSATAKATKRFLNAWKLG